MPNNPIQVVLDRERFHQRKEFKRSPRDKKDFYEDDDDKFIKHRKALSARVQEVSIAIRRQGIGYARVSMRGDALAKGHRPYTIFDPSKSTVVGANDVGELLIEVTPTALESAAAQIARAEPETRKKVDSETGRVKANPSPQRHEVGAIHTVRLHDTSDRLTFSARDAVAWLSDRRTTGSYHVQLFRMPPSRSDWDELPDPLRRLYIDFTTGLEQFPGLECERLTQTHRHNRWIAVRLSKSGARAFQPFATRQTMRMERLPRAQFDDDLQRHAALLAFLCDSPLVRSIGLAPKLAQNRKAQRREPAAEPAIVPQPDPGRSYPIVAVVDGGVSLLLDDWVLHRRNILADEHRDLEHGTFIGGLLVGAAANNPPNTVPWEADGCSLVDVAICPDFDNPDAADAYDGVPGFLDELEQSVYALRSRFGVRVFNISANTEHACQTDNYSFEAQRLDEIADENDVIIVQSAGNLRHEARPEWTSDDSVTQAMLAACRDPSVLVPAESIRNVSVAAINPNVVDPLVADAPCGYSRRGPGLRCGVKPDLAHYGGAAGHGLRSIDSTGTISRQWGTSYATPLVAKTLASIDAQIEGDVSRETLLALLIHHATIPAPLRRPRFRALARDFIGFGIPAPVTDILSGPDSSITLVFAGRLRPQMEFLFDFSWPTALTLPMGACRGKVRMTLVASPPLDPSFGGEIARVNIDASLQQQQSVKGWKGKPNQYMKDVIPGAAGLLERDRIEEALKWSPTKVYEAEFKRGVGKSSLWRLKVDAIARAEQAIPQDGVPFTVIITISDPKTDAPVFNEMRAALQRAGVRLNDIQTAARVVPRV